MTTHFCRIRDGGGTSPTPTIHLRTVEVTLANHAPLEREFIGD